MIHRPTLPPKAGHVEYRDANGVPGYRAVNGDYTALGQALELILSGETGEEDGDETGA